MAINNSLSPTPLSTLTANGGGLLGQLQQKNANISKLSGGSLSGLAINSSGNLGRSSTVSTGTTGLLKPPALTSASSDGSGAGISGVPPANPSVAGKIQGDPLLNVPGTTTPIRGTPPVATSSTTGAGSADPTASTTGTNTSPQGILSGLVSTATTPNPLLTQDISKQQELASEYGPALATVTNTPGLLANQNARASNLTTAYGNEMQGLGTNINALTTLQGTQQSGLNEAGGLAQQTTSSPYGQPLIYTNSGQAISGGQPVSNNGTTGGGINLSGAPATDIQNLTAQLINNPGSIGYTQAYNQLSSAYGAAVANQLLPALEKASPNFSTTQSDAQAQNAATKTTAQTNANASSVGALTNQVSTIQSTASGASANFKLMQSIAEMGGINDSSVPVLNTLQQNVAKGLTSSAAVTSFQSLLSSTRSQYALILGGGTATDQTQQEAASLIPDNISLSALDSLGTNLESDAQNRISGINQQINALGGSSNNSTSGSGTGGSGTSVSGFGWNGTNG